MPVEQVPDEWAHEALDAFECGIALLACDATVLFLNRCAEASCSGDGPLSVVRRDDGTRKLRAVRPEDDTVLRAAIAGTLSVSLARLAVETTPRAVVLVRGSRGRQALVTTTPMQTRATTATPACAAMLVIEEPGVPRDIDARTLRTLFGLTAAETRVARALVAGHAPKRVAETLGVSEHTVRTQLRAIYGKTQTRGVTRLVGLLSGLSQMQASRGSAPRRPTFTESR